MYIEERLIGAASSVPSCDISADAAKKRLERGRGMLREALKDK